MGATADSGPAQDAREAAAASKGVYVVQLGESPVVRYEGGIAGLEATKPDRGSKINPQDNKVQKYVSYLDSRHAAVLAQVGGGKKLYDYRYAYNGFAAQLSPTQVEKLKAIPGVISVEPAQEWAPATSTTPTFLGLTGPGGLWEQLGGPDNAGEGLVVGVVDTGIWPEHPSVSDRLGKKLEYRRISGWHGHCASSETVTDGSWDANLCNQKLIGARFFIETYEAFGNKLVQGEFRSPRDYDGHGTHTSTTAAGNFGVEPTGDAAGFGAISGMAPRARISTYKACWEDGDPTTGGCFTTDTAAAIDMAVRDGVDAINFSISGTSTSFLNVVEVSAFNAAAAGVFVAMSAGNTGPGASTVNHPSPWLTTVGASTHSRPASGIVQLGNGMSFTGASQIKTAVGPAPFVRAQDVAKAGANATHATLCFSSAWAGNTTGAPVLDPAKVTGKIVLCQRGTNDRVDKSRAVREVGGIGMVLVNPTPNSLNADLHFVPTVHLPNTNLAALDTYAQTAGATARLLPDPAPVVTAPQMGAFSSRGPSLATGDLLKPDVTAPGVDVLAGYSPRAAGRLFEVVSGTSMSSPHVAGLGLLLKHRRPTWTPMMIKSALMTTGTDTLDSFGDSSTASGAANRAFAQGAGHVRPTSAADPGLVYNSGPNDWIKFLCGTGQLTGPLCAGGSIDPSDLNLASIAIGDLAGTQTITRTVTNVGSASETYTAAVSLPGITAVVSPSSFTIAPGATQTFTVAFARTTAPINVYQAGHLTWTGSAGHSVRSPVVIRPVSLRAPAEVALTGGSASWSIKSGVSDTITLGKRGLQAAVTDSVTLADDPDDNFDTAAPESNTKGVFKKEVVVPAGQAVLRFATFDVDTDGNDDLDMYLYRLGTGAPTLVALSAGPTAEEVVTLRNPTAATYRVYVHAFETDGPDVNFTLFGWTLGTADAGNMTVNGPFTATIGSEHTVNVSATGLVAGRRYLGQITYNGTASGAIGTPTIVTARG